MESRRNSITTHILLCAAFIVITVNDDLAEALEVLLCLR